ncbi:DNA-3-methyladenine glycosylase I [Flavobacterium fryxellicola]|uniref:DNA-3-methyladenine glycosylase I n=1 Tax=Flavobacterium fryxellicola TaxID=249352 RepID=A0A167XAM2_9FLAO|nr:DNA-3-methyladenine glycosylase I [Flavobacterium fryxellicola]OAB28167.1 DNA-3-methyladenine glycosylase [Flavobacterium fryxellicola]SHN77845.1 DNA-3-methyladenine glycosylase I [Flavobacterium fryxellicola]
MDEKIRCGWCTSSDLYKKYHDEEWGVPAYDDATLFEFLILETFQAGLSWITILNKRGNFRKAFDHFDYEKIAQYNDDKILDLLQDAGIIRNKLKVYSAVTNAQAFIKIQEEFESFSNYIWNFVDGKPVINNRKSFKEVPATTLLSDMISKDLKKRGFKFVGSTVVYAYLQATGIVNDHVENCWKASQPPK